MELTHIDHMDVFEAGHGEILEHLAT